MRFLPSFLLTATLPLLAATPTFAGAIVNGGFEDPITFNGPPFEESWEGFNGSGVSFAANSVVMPRSGSMNLEVSILNSNDSFAGVFQDIVELVPGTETTFSGWHMTPSSPLDLTVEIRIEWRKAGVVDEISRTGNISPVPFGEYSMFSLSAVVPLGADTARIVYAIQTYTGGPTNNGTVYVDDVTFAVPEPMSATSLTFGAVLLGTIRRRRS